MREFWRELEKERTDRGSRDGPGSGGHHSPYDAALEQAQESFLSEVRAMRVVIHVYEHRFIRGPELCTACSEPRP